MYPLLIGMVTAFPFLCACMFSIVDLRAVLGTVIGFPPLEIYLQATGSKEAASVAMAMFALCFFACLVGGGMYFLKDKLTRLTFCVSDNIFSSYLGNVSRWCIAILSPMDEGKSNI